MLTTTAPATLDLEHEAAKFGAVLTEATQPDSDSHPGDAGDADRAVPAARQRDRYIDTLRVLALARVIAYHVTGWVMLPILFPSMGIMFALAGSLMASSLDRSPQNPWRVLRKRLRRMLPPLWALGAVLVPLMLVLGWTAGETDRGSAFGWTTILFWVLPIADPPASAQGFEWVIPLWYIRAYLWFVLVSPMMLWCFRRWPVKTFLTPLAVLFGYNAGLVELNGAEGDVVLKWAVFGACWILGFAHHDDLIRKISLRKVLPAALAFMAAGLAWGYLNPSPESGFTIPDIPGAESLYGLGFVLLLLRMYPDFSWIAKIRWLDTLVSAMNKRAMTIYLWGNVAIFAALTLLGATPAFETLMVDGDIRGTALVLTLTWALIAVAVLAFGWVEDLAAKRPAQLLPVARRSKRRAPSLLPDLTEARASAPFDDTAHQESEEQGRHCLGELMAQSAIS